MTTALPAFHAARAAGVSIRITCFGSSTTEGTGASSPAATYPEVMLRRLLPHCPGGVTAVNLGIGGETALEMDGRLPEVIRSEPHLVLWQTGSNDVTRPVPIERFEALTRSGLARLRATGADVAFIDQQYSAALEACDSLPAFRERLHRIARDAGAPVFPRHDAMRAWCDEGAFTIDTLSPDGTHMADPGYRRLGEAVADWLLRHG